MALKLTQAGDYAIRSMLYIASFPEGRAVLRSEVSEAEGIPLSFTAKILRSLVRAGVLRSTRGVHGGFTLARPASEINLLQVVEAIEGPIALTACVPFPGACERASNCPASEVWEAVQAEMARILEQATLEVLVSTPRRNGRVSLNGLANGDGPRPPALSLVAGASRSAP
jgi:Rrf2 family protein